MERLGANERLVLDAMRDHPAATRNDLATVTGLPRTTLVGVVSRLLGRGLLEEREGGAAGRRGRRASVLALPPGGSRIGVIAVSHGQLRSAVVGTGGEVVSRRDGGLGGARDEVEIVDRGLDLLGAASATVGLAASDLAEIVVGIPAPFERGVVFVWFPGDEGGWAIADLLSGRANPGGRLPFTWPAQLTQGVANDPAHPERSSHGVNPGTTTPCTSTASGPGAVPNCETRYTEGVDVGYRWYDRQGLTPLFPFGYGLSYTSFAYSKLQAHQTREGLDVTFQITNTGHRDGDVTPQVYLGAPAHPPAGAQFAVRALAGFDRVSLRAGQSRQVTVHVTQRQLQYWSTSSGRWRTATGTRQLSVAASATTSVLNRAVIIH